MQQALTNLSMDLRLAELQLSICPGALAEKETAQKQKIMPQSAKTWHEQRQKQQRFAVMIRKQSGRSQGGGVEGKCGVYRLCDLGGSFDLRPLLINDIHDVLLVLLLRFQQLLSMQAG